MNSKQLPYDVLTLPHAYSGGRVCFSIKSRPEDFRVTEVLGFTPSGSGEHLFLFIEKKSLTTTYVRELLAQAFHVPPQTIGYSGLKDKHAITQQWFSIKTKKTSGDISAFLLEQKASSECYFKIVSEHRNNKKLKIGTHKSNDFSILLEKISAVAENSIDRGEIHACKISTSPLINQQCIALIEDKLKRIARFGVPNYFGPQRFGFQGANIEKAMHLLEVKKKRSKEKTSIYISAARSFLFNELLAQRVTVGNWRTYHDGDKLILTGSKSFFTIDPNNTLDRDDVIARLEANDIAIAGELYASTHAGSNRIEGGTFQGSDKIHNLLPCRDGLEPSETIATRLKSVLNAIDLKPSLRPLAVLPKNLVCLKEGSAENTKLRLSFNLPAGAYATALLKELGDF